MDHADFRVRGRVFAYFLHDHHGDGIVSVCVKTALGENVDRAGREAERFYLPAYIGHRGWLGVRLDRARIDWCEIDALLRQSYRLVAPKGLLRLLDAQDDPARSDGGKSAVRMRTPRGLRPAKPRRSRCDNLCCNEVSRIER